jgi:hypothetical protein
MPPTNGIITALAGITISLNSILSKDKKMILRVTEIAAFWKGRT